MSVLQHTRRYEKQATVGPRRPTDLLPTLLHTLGKCQGAGLGAHCGQTSRVGQWLLAKGASGPELTQLQHGKDSVMNPCGSCREEKQHQQESNNVRPEGCNSDRNAFLLTSTSLPMTGKPFFNILAKVTNPRLTGHEALAARKHDAI